MPKKEQRGAFWFFMEEFRETLPASQRKIPRNNLSVLASEKWGKMTDQQKEKYKEQAKLYKLNPVYKEKEVKFTTDGRTFADVEAAEKAAKKKTESMKIDITNRVKLAEIKNCLHEQRFYFMHVNYYCMLENNNYMPCELAICEYSIRSGIIRTYHKFIHPGNIPVGYTGEVKRVSDEIHKVPYPPPEGAIKDHYKLYQEVKRFLESGREEDGKLPPVYTYYGAENFHFNKENEIVVESVLTTLCGMAGLDMHYKVYPLRRLFFELYNACVRTNRVEGKNGFASDNIPYLLLEQDTYSHKTGLSCDLHEEIDAPQFCSLSLVQRWSFPISYYCCNALGIPVVPGKHCPIDMKIECNPVLGAEPTRVTEAAYVASRSTGAANPTTDVAGKSVQGSSANSTPAPQEERQEVRKPYQESLQTTYKRIPKTAVNPDSDDFVARERKAMRGIQMEKPLILSGGRGRGYLNIGNLSLED